MSWNIQKPGDYINGPLTVAGTATITGNLTVDTNTLFVDSTLDKVGVGVANLTGLSKFNVAGDIALTSDLVLKNSGGTVQGYIFGSSGINYRVIAGQSHIWQESGTDLMRLNSTGLGVGVAPSYKLDVSSSSNIVGRVSSSSVLNTGFNIVNTTGSTWSLYSFGSNDATLQNSFGIYHSNGTSFLQITQAGNVGVGVTPSAWSGNTAIQLKSSASSITGAIFQGANAGANANGFAYNCYFDGTNWQYIFGTSHPATRYQQSQGIHSWFNAASGTGAISTFTQAMTLDASGNLYLGSASSYLACRLNLQVTNAQPDAIYIRNSAAALSLYWRLGYVNSSNTFHILNQTGNGVYLWDGATSWTGTSDERLKDIIEPISNAVAKVGSLRSVIGKFKTDSEGKRRSFLIAQDVQAVLPEAVDDRNPDKLGVAYTDVIPLLVAAIKELTARVEAMEA